MSCICIKGKEQSPHCSTHAALQCSRVCARACLCMCSHPILNKNQEGLSYISLAVRGRWKLRCERFSIRSDFPLFQECLQHFPCPTCTLAIPYWSVNSGSFSRKQTPWLGTLPSLVQWSIHLSTVDFQFNSTFEAKKCWIINPVLCVPIYWTS